MRPRLLDLFCGAGGSAMGYHQAGFDVVGVDINPQPYYPFECHRADAVTFDLDGFDAYHAGPPCQSYTTMSNAYGSDAPQLIDVIRPRLEATGKPWVIENVTGARKYMRDPIMLHGGQFRLKVMRHRLFEANFPLFAPPKAPRPKDVVAIYGRDERSRTPRPLWKRTDGTWLYQATLEEARGAMEMPWCDWQGLREAVPPAYTFWIGLQMILECHPQ